MPNLGNFRLYAETDVIQLYKYAGAYPVNKGTFVKIGSGWLNDNPAIDIDTVATVGSTPGNTVSTRWGLPSFVLPSAASGDAVVGMLLYDGKETDENSEKYLYNPRKAAENSVFISGQSAPVVTRGIFLYSGVEGAETTAPTAGAAAYLGVGGAVNISGSAGNTLVTKVGQFLGPVDGNGFVLVRVAV